MQLPGLQSFGRRLVSTYGCVMTTNLTAAASSLLEEAANASSGRAAQTLQSEAHAPLKQTLMALRAAQSLADHTAPGPATILVLEGSVLLRSAEGDVDLGTGDWAPIPKTVHSLHAKDDTVVLLTVASAQA